ncbi:MAG: OmpA/MotB family protein, partial [Candidatus Binatia bacterium]
TSDMAMLPDAPDSVERSAPSIAPRMAALGHYLGAFVQAAGLANGATVTIGESEVRVAMGGTIGFSSGSADLLAAADPLLREIRSLAHSMPDLEIEVAGYTDDVPIRTPRFPSNLELSLARAARVAHELGAADPSVPVRMVTMGFGENRAVAPNADPNGRAQNRRVEVRLLAVDHSIP